MLYHIIAIQIIFHLAAIIALFHFSTSGLIAFLSLYFVTGGLGISIGYHRLLTHKSFHTPVFIKKIFAIFGLLAWQGGPISWVSIHRAHHFYTEKEKDPHDATKGFFWSHMGWSHWNNPNNFNIAESRRLIPDLLNNKYYTFLERNGLAINLLFAVIFYFLTDIYTFLWAFPLRIVVVWHLTWFVNSVSHGVYPFYKSKVIEPKNVWWVALLTFGEGWHANHHEKQFSPTFQKKIYQIDPGYLIIVFLSYLRISKIKKPIN